MPKHHELEEQTSPQNGSKTTERISESQEAKLVCYVSHLPTATVAVGHVQWLF
jgi:hypothetical protein